MAYGFLCKANLKEKSKKTKMQARKLRVFRRLLKISIGCYFPHKKVEKI